MSLHFTGMPGVLALAGLFLVLLIPGARSESAELRFQGQTEFVVNESSRAIVRLVVERVGDPINVTALVLVSASELDRVLREVILAAVVVRVVGAVL